MEVKEERPQALAPGATTVPRITMGTLLPSDPAAEGDIARL